MTAPLSVHTENLTLTVAGVEAAVRSTGDRLFVEVDTVRDGVRLARALGTDVESWVPTRALVGADLTVEVRVRGRTVFVLGAGAKPGVTSRLFDVSSAEIRPLGILAALSDGGRALRGAGRRLLA